MSDTKPPINLSEMDFGHTLRGLQKGDCVFDRFALQRLLGRGGMGVVWLGLDQRLGREVALKFAPEVVRWDDLAVEELKEETRKGLGLAHPNIVKVYDFLLDEEHAAISMEFIDGENLASLRTRQPNKIFEPKQIAGWVSDLLEALDYAHTEAKVIHRDLKPANLMIDRAGHLRITDFGIAKSISDAMDRATIGGASTGTLAYMSPQQASGRLPQVSDDMYALGSTLYELLTGKPPFFTGNIAQQLSDETPVSPSQRRAEFGIFNAEPLPSSWEKTVLACLAKRPEERPASAREIQDRLQMVPSSKTTSLMGGGMTALKSTRVAEKQQQQTASLPLPANPPRPANPPMTVRESRPPEVKPQQTKSTPLQWTKAPEPLKAAPVAPTAKKEPATSAVKKGPSRAFPVVMVVVLVVMLFLFGGVVLGGWWAYQHYGTELKDKWAHLRGTPPPEPQKPTVATSEDLTFAPPIATSVPSTDKPSTSQEKPATQSPPQSPSAFTTINNAIEKAQSGDTIVVPNGSYDEQIRMKPGIHLKGETPGKVFVRTDGKSGQVVTVESCQTGSISGFMFEHSGSDVSANVSWPVVMIKSSSITFTENVIQSGLADGMIITGSSRPSVDHCTFSKNTGNGLVIESGAEGTITACEMRKNGASGVEVRFIGTAPVLEGNVCTDNAGSGITIKDQASAVIKDSGKDHTQLVGNTQAGIAASGSGVSATISGAECKDNLIGITIRQGAVAKISQCVVQISRDTGIQIAQAGSNCEVLSNSVESSNFDGIMVSGSSATPILIKGNKSKLNAYNGIFVFGAGFNPVIEDNEAENNGRYGILSAQGCTGVLKNNKTLGNKIEGVSKQ